MGVVEEKKAKHRILHDMTFAGSKNKGGSGPVMAEWSNVPSGELSEVRTDCLLYTSPSPRDGLLSRMPSSA